MINPTELPKVKKRLYIISGCVVAVIALLIGAGFYMLDYSLKPENTGRDLEGSFRYMYKEYPGLENWVDSLKQAEALKDTFIVASDGARLHAYYIPAAVPTAKTSVIVHGYTDNAIRMLMIGYLYNHDLGYNVLLPDLRNAGLSDGDHFQMGWLDRLDVLQWMDVANQIYGDSTRMVVHGISMGAATTMMVSGEKQQPYVKCFVEDCGYTDVWDEFAYKLKEDFGLPSFPLMNVTSALSKLKYGWSFKEASALKQVEKSTLPMFFIHGDADTYVPTYMVNALYDAKTVGDKERWIVPGAIHAMSYRDNVEEYTRKVKKFTEEFI